ncbi:hypothetical protein CROQUDRAFT_660959, partial [Cronartium quercuum f. sp. fusiforme G11]
MLPNILHLTSTHPDLSLLSPLRTCPPSSCSIFSSNTEPDPTPTSSWLQCQSTLSNELSASTIVTAPDIPSNHTNPQEVKELLTHELASHKSSW